MILPRRLFASAWVIARRDFIATVWSRSFLLFLLGPIIAGVFGGLLGKVGAQTDQIALQPVIVFAVSGPDRAPLESAYKRLDDRIDDLPRFRFDNAEPDAAAQANRLLSNPRTNVALVVTGWPNPRITGTKANIDANAPMARLVMEDATTAATLDRAGVKARHFDIDFVTVKTAGSTASVDRYVLARAAQTMLFFLTILLAGMLLSNLVEEKSNKVIEVLAAAVPVDAIFLGKLAAMLSVSLTGVAIWTTLIGGSAAAALSGKSIPDPATGWPVFVALGILYFVMNYLILGGLFLGIGSQAATVRDVQTLSMPITVAQLAIFAGASAVVNDLDKPWGLAAAVFPLTSPLTMIARGAQDGALWPHVLALAWQALWVVLIIRFAARRFRVGVLKSGSPPGRGWFGRRKSA